MHPQTIAVLKSRADGLGLIVEVGDENTFNVDKDVSGVLVQYPATDGSIHDYKVCFYYHHAYVQCITSMHTTLLALAVQACASAVLFNDDSAPLQLQDMHGLGVCQATLVLAL